MRPGRDDEPARVDRRGRRCQPAGAAPIAATVPSAM